MKEWRELVEASKEQGVNKLHISSNKDFTRVRFHGQAFLLFEREASYGVNLLISACRDISDPPISLKIDEKVIIKATAEHVVDYLGAIIEITIQPLYNEADQRQGVVMRLLIEEFNTNAQKQHKKASKPTRF